MRHHHHGLLWPLAAFCAGVWWLGWQACKWSVLGIYYLYKWIAIGTYLACKWAALGLWRAGTAAVEASAAVPTVPAGADEPPTVTIPVVSGRHHAA